MKSRKKNYILYVSSRLWVILFVLFVFGSQISFALPVEENVKSTTQQGNEIKGVIYDENNLPMVGVNVVIKGTSKGVVTDLNGEFSIVAPEGSTLVISFLGYNTEEVVLSGLTYLEVTLTPDLTSLQEVVVIGYGTQNKATVTGSLSTVSSEELTEQPVSSVSQALAGRLPGLVANQAGGRPGFDNSTIKIRGIATLDAGAGSNPLIMIDGIERDQTALNFLDPNEIENLSILKDASATAVFGVRGANGVIIVTTKRGKEGPAKIVYKGSMSVLIPDRSIDVLNSYQQTGMLNEYNGYEMNSTDPNAPYPQAERDRFLGVLNGEPVDPTDPYFYPSTDYADVMLKDYATQQQHNFTVSGGTKKVKFFTSLGYFNQGGMFENINPDLDKSTSYTRYNYRTNIDVNLTRTTLAKINIGGSYNETISLGQGNEPSQSFYWNLLRHSSPWEAYLHEDKVVMLDENANSVMLNSDMRGYNQLLRNNNDYTFVIDQKLDFITSGLSIKATASLISFYSNNIKRGKDAKKLPYWEPVVENDSVVFYQVKEDVLPYNSTAQNKNRKEYYEFALNYNRTFLDKHTFTALALVNAEKWHFSQNTLNEVPRAYMGLVGRATYNYMNRYMLEFNLGMNGSENFAEGNRFGYFPAYSVGWTFTEEPWLQDLIGNSVVSYGKFRFSYGTVGNDKLRIAGEDKRFLYLPDTYVMDKYNHNGWHDVGVNFGRPGETVNYPIALQDKLGNPIVTWENAVKINYAVDMNFFSNLLSLTAEYFTEERTDILIVQKVEPIYQQTGEKFLNLGEVHNKGFEIELGFNKTFGDTRVFADFNYTHTRNKIIEMDEPMQQYDYRAQTGTRVGEVWGYQQEDFFRTEDEATAYRDELWARYSELNPDAMKEDYQAYQIFTSGYDVSAGDLKFIDRNGDGIITDLDQGYLDIPNFPEDMYGLRFGVTHKKISLSVFLQGAKNYAINVRTDVNPDPTKGSLLDFVEYRYTPERYEAGERIEFPRLLSTNDNWSDVGSYWMRDASYLRLKNVELAYTFDNTNKFIDALGIDNIRVYANGMNLLTFSSIKYMDPETTNGKLKYPRSRVINLGLQVQF